MEKILSNPPKYKRGEEPWNKWFLVYRCKQCDSFVTMRPSAQLLAAMDMHSREGEQTEGNMLQLAIGGLASGGTAHQCDERSIGIADLCGVIREGSNIMVIGG